MRTFPRVRMAFLLTSLLACWASLASAQQFSVRAFGGTSGLDSQTINLIFQDHRGFVWVGTEMGLYRSNGASFERMGAANGFATGQFMRAMTEDVSGKLWLATQSGLYRGDGVHFHPLAPDGKPLIADADQRLVAMPDGRVLVVRGHQVLALTEKTDASWHAQPLFEATQLRRHPQLADIKAMQRSGDQLWLGCGSNVCLVTAGRVTVFDSAAGVPDDTWTSFHVDRTGATWLEGHHAIRVRAKGATAFEPRDFAAGIGNNVKGGVAMAEDAAGRMLVRNDQGIARWNGTQWQQFGVHNGLPAAAITALLLDRFGDLWLGTYASGIHLWSGYGKVLGWTRAQGMDSVPTWSIARDDKDRMWFANAMGGNVLDAGARQMRTWPVAVNPEPRQNISMQKAADGAMWIATYEGRLLRFDPAVGTTSVVAHLPSFIKAIHIDRNGRVWIATVHGVYVIDQPGQQPMPTDAAQIKPGACSDMAEAVDGTLWFACDNGMLRLAKGSWSLLHADKADGSGGFTTVAVEADGSLWLGIGQAGLRRAQVNGTALKLERVSDRWLDKGAAYFIRHDVRGWVWVGGGAGVDVFDGKQWAHLSHDSGLLWDESDQNAFFADADGSVWIGSSMGVSHILQPAGIFKTPPRKVSLIDVQHGTASLADGASVDMSGQTAPLTFLFARVGSASASAPRYRYRLLGSASGWVETGASKVDITALPAGDYTFEIQLIDDDLRSLSAPVSFHFSVAPIWWRSWWAVAGALTLLALLIAWAWRWRTRAFRLRYQQLDALLAQRTAELAQEKNLLLKAQEQLRAVGSIDRLTGLPNRDAILANLQTALADPALRRRGMTVALIDLDHFKGINDAHGLAAGDAVLRSVAQRLSGHLRSSDALGRYGGEAMLLVLADTGIDEAQRRLQMLRALASADPYDWRGTPLTVTLSAGMAWVDAGVKTSPHKLVARAEKAVEAAKQAGRNRVVVAT